VTKFSERRAPKPFNWPSHTMSPGWSFATIWWPILPGTVGMRGSNNGFFGANAELTFPCECVSSTAIVVDKKHR
jgi:hypothetical protein